MSGLFLQLLLDLLNWSALLYLCGGATNPFRFLLFGNFGGGSGYFARALGGVAGTLSLLAYSLLSYFYLPLRLANTESQ